MYVNKLNQKQMKKFENTWNYFVFLRGTGNPDFRQYTDVSTTQIALVDSLEEAVEKSQKYISKWDLGYGNWTGDYPGDVLSAGNVFNLDGNLVKQISYTGSFSEPKAKQRWQQNNWRVQFDSYNRWQTNRLEAILHDVGAKDVISEDWTGSLIERGWPEIHTFCNIEDMTINQILEISKKASPYVYLGHVDIETELCMKTKLCFMKLR
jgi:hypothetical protein